LAGNIAAQHCHAAPLFIPKSRRNRTSDLADSRAARVPVAPLIPQSRSRSTLSQGGAFGVTLLRTASIGIAGISDHRKGQRWRYRQAR
jgi:hypothetical protein